jgi:hypothetical protein
MVDRFPFDRDDGAHDWFEEQGGVDADGIFQRRNAPPPPTARDCREPVTATTTGEALSEARSPRLQALGLCYEQVAFLCAWALGGFSDPAVLADGLGFSEDAVAWRFRRIRKRKGLGLDNSAQLAALLTHLAHDAGLAGLFLSTGRLACGYNREEER